MMCNVCVNKCTPTTTGALTTLVLGRQIGVYIMVSGSCILFQAAVLTLGFLVYVSRQPNDPITAEEILQDGGDYVVAPDGRFIEYFTCGANLPGAEWVYMQHGYGSTGKFIHSFKTMCKEAAENNLKLFSPSGATT